MAIKQDISSVLQELSDVKYGETALSAERCAAAISRLDSAQREVIFSAKGLEKAQQDEVVSMIKAAAAAESLSLKEAARAANMSEIELLQALEIETTNKLTASKLLSALAEGRLTQEQYDGIIAKTQSIAANKALGASYDELSLKQKLAATAAAMTPMGWITLLLGVVGVLHMVITGIVKLGDELAITAKGARDAADELHSAFEETKSELEGVNSELKTSHDRIAELQKLSDAGTITLVEQEELNSLKEEVALLERRKAILDEQARNEAKEADEALVKAFDKVKFDSTARERYTAERDRLQKQFDALIDDGDIEAANNLYDRIHQLNDILASGYDYTSGKSLDKGRGFREHIEDLIATYQELGKTAVSDMSESTLAVFEDTRKKLVEAASTLQTEWIDNLEVDDETRASWQTLFDEIDRCINPAEHLTKALENLPVSAKSKLQDLGEAGALTAERVQELASEFPELAALLETSGITAEAVAAHFNAMSVSAGAASESFESVKTSVGDVLEPLNELSEKYELLSAAQKELDENNQISNSTLDKFHEQYEAMADIIALYKLGLATAQDVYAEYERLYNADRQSFIDSNAWKIANTEEYFNKNIKGHKEWIDAIGEYYASDFKNFSELARKKLEIESGLIQKLGANWSKYYATYASAVRNSYVMLDSEGEFHRSKSAGGMQGYKGYSDYVKAETARQYASWDSAKKSAYDNAMSLANAMDAMSGLMKNIDLDLNLGVGSSAGSKSGSSAGRKIEEYIADIDKYREATERLRKAQEDKEQVNRRLNSSEVTRERILLERQIIGVFQNESDALQTLNKLRRGTISGNAESLRKLGFEVRYNAETNELWISNLEHLNELTAKSKGKYDSLQEATNALRKDTEDLIEATSSLNEENQDGANSIYELGVSVHDTKAQIVDDLKAIVSQASGAVDEIQNVYDTLKAAADEYAENGGFISVDAFQKIIGLGPQYMQYLRDENGLLVINEENINRVIAAKTRQLAAEQALTYVERLQLAMRPDSAENLNDLLYATTDLTDATFGLAYAQLDLMHTMGDLDDQQYAAALHNIQSIESIANTAISSIGQVAEESGERTREELENMKSGVDDILKYVMDMLKHRIQEQIKALEDIKDAYGNIIDLRKEAMDTAKKEAEYEDKVAEKVKQIAKLQERINALSLDDSRDAQAQKIKLEEEMAELQKELSADQNDYAVDAQKDALDDMKEAYDAEKDAEITTLEETISSYQKLYSMAISYIESHWETLYDELISYNTEYGSVLNSEITEAWDNCLAAAQRYGSYVSALGSIGADIDAASSSGGASGASNNTVVADSNHSAPAREDSIHAIIKEMYDNMNEHGGSGSSTSTDRKTYLSQRNLQLGDQLAQYGVSAWRSTDKEDYGTWYTDRAKTELLFDKYRKYIYHSGGIAGDNPTLKQNEIMAVLEKGEAVLDEQKERGLYRLVEFATTLSDKFSEFMKSSGLSSALIGPGGAADVKPDAPPRVTNSERVSIEFGDTIIYGADEGTVEQHRAITRQQANELLDKLNIRR